MNLVLDVQQRDRFGRLLAYVYVGDRFVNAELLWRGYAEAATYPPSVRYADYFAGLQHRPYVDGANPAIGVSAQASVL